MDIMTTRMCVSACVCIRRSRSPVSIARPVDGVKCELKLSLKGGERPETLR